MVERSSNPGGLTFAAGRVPDNDTIQQPRRQLPLATRQFVYGVICAAIVLALMVVGIVREVLS